MLVRVLIVIVVVAVLGFFGTRGSEKVVAEVTERQELVDELAKRVKQLEDKNRALEAELAQQNDQLAKQGTDLQRATDQLHQRLSDLERREAARVAATPTTATIRVTMARQVLLYVNGAPALDSAPHEPLHLQVGTHTLEVDNGQKRVRYALLVRQPTADNRLLIDGTSVRAVGDLVVTRAR